MTRDDLSKPDASIGAQIESIRKSVKIANEDLGKIYLMKWQTSGFSDVVAMTKLREHLENQVKYRGSYSRQSLDGLALLSSLEGGFRCPSLEGRTLKAFRSETPKSYN